MPSLTMGRGNGKDTYERPEDKGSSQHQTLKMLKREPGVDLDIAQIQGLSYQENDVNTITIIVNASTSKCYEVLISDGNCITRYVSELLSFNTNTV